MHHRAFYNANRAGLTFWTPNINIYRDPRWDRGQETPGEDPLLSGEYAISFVRRLQGEVSEAHNKTSSSSFTAQPLETKFKSKFLKVSASYKHFSSYSQEVPHHRNDAIVTKRDQLNTYFPAFEDCVKRGLVSSIMCSYNAVNGIPSCTDKALLTGLVRDQWGFDGYIVSDCGAVADVMEHHHYTQTPEQTCATILNTDIDINCGNYLVPQGFLSRYGKKPLTSGLLHKSVVQRALKNLFRVQMRLGVFEKGGQPFADITTKAIDTAAHRQLALEAARQSVVLLKNENALLPLKSSAFSSGEGSSLALIGPHFNASEVFLGNYNGKPSFIVTPLGGVSESACGAPEPTYSAPKPTYGASEPACGGAAARGSPRPVRAPAPTPAPQHFSTPLGHDIVVPSVSAQSSISPRDRSPTQTSALFGSGSILQKRRAIEEATNQTTLPGVSEPIITAVRDDAVVTAVDLKPPPLVGTEAKGSPLQEPPIAGDHANDVPPAALPSKPLILQSAGPRYGTVYSKTDPALAVDEKSAPQAWLQ